MSQAAVARPPAQGIPQLRMARVSGGSGRTIIGQGTSEAEFGNCLRRKWPDHLGRGGHTTRK
eukprot:3237648-Pyramimonas_sp.AAC.1